MTGIKEILLVSDRLNLFMARVRGRLAVIPSCHRNIPLWNYKW